MTESSWFHRKNPESLLLCLLAIINTISIFGFVAFTLNPSNLARFPWAVSIYSWSYPIFARMQIALAFAALFVFLFRRTRWQWLTSFLATFVLSSTSELLGTTWGFPFGAYTYTDLLGPKMLGRVPYLIPLSWYFMALPSFALSRHLFSKPSQWPVRWVLASLLLLSWDLTLDPAMSYLTPFWLWGDTGSYYGMPALNLVGWFVTGMALMMAFDLLKVSGWLKNLPVSFFAAFYGVNLMLPLGMCALAGLTDAIWVTSVVYGLYAVLFFYSPTRRWLASRRVSAPLGPEQTAR